MIVKNDAAHGKSCTSHCHCGRTTGTWTLPVTMFALSMSNTPVTPLPPRVTVTANACVVPADVSVTVSDAPFATTVIVESCAEVEYLFASFAAMVASVCWLGSGTSVSETVYWYRTPLIVSVHCSLACQLPWSVRIADE